MEEEQGDVVPVSSNEVSELSLSGNLTRETLVENQAEESFEEGDGGEIMVEIVGSDVFVDGVSGQKEGDVVAGEVENLQGHVWEDREETKTQTLPKAMAAASEGDGDKLVKSELGLSESRGEQNSVVSEKIEVRVSESVHVDGGAVSELSSREVVPNDEVWNPGIEAADVASSAAAESMSGKAEEVAGKSSVVVAEESAIEDEAVENNGDSNNKANFELQSDPMGILTVGDSCIAYKKEINKTIDRATGKDCLVADSAIEKKNAAAVGEVTPSVDPNGEGFETAHVEGVDVVEELNAEEGREVSPAVDPNGEDFRTALVYGIDVVADTGSANSDATLPVDRDHSDPTPSVTMSCNIAASEIATPAGDGGEILTTGSSEVGVSSANAESVSSDGDHGMNAKVADEKEILEAESKDLIPGSNNLQSHAHDENQGSKEIPGTDSASHEQSFVNDREEVMGMDLDDGTEFKDGTLEVNNLPCASKDEILETGEDLETDVVLQNHVSSSEQTQLADNGETSASREDSGLGVKNQAGVEQNLAHTSNPSSAEDKEIVKADSGKHPDQPVVGTVVDEVTNDQNIVTSQVKIADEDGSRERSKVVDAKIATEFIECHETAKSPELDSSIEYMHLPENNASSQVETVEIVMSENLVVCNDPVVTAEIEPNNLVEECGFPQTKIVEASVPKSETPNDEVSKLESVCLIPNEVTAIAAVSDTNHVDTLQETTGKAELHVSDTDISLLDGGDIQDTLMIDVSTLNGEVPEFGEAENNSSKGNHIMEGHTSEAEVMEVEESEYDQKHQEGNEVEWRERESGTDEPASDTDKLMVSNGEAVKTSSSLRMNQSGYLAAPGNDGQFAVSDLVWGKVRSHPWWPGQIFDPADASDKAVKHYKKDSYLVAYFGDRTFAWNDATLLKPFKMQFSQIEKQSSSEAFQNAVSCALEEVSRRVELGLTCSCTPKDVYGKIETQVVENTGIREESSHRYGVDQSSRATSFEPDKLLQYVRDLAPRASSGADRLDIVIARAQLSAFCRFKGYRPPADYRLSGQLLENDADTEQIGDEIVGSHKNKQTPNDSLQSPKKERRLTDLVGDTYSIDGEDEFVQNPSKSVSLLSGNKRKALDPLADGSDKRLSVHAAKVSASANQNPKPSFKIGECIRRVASQLTGSTAMVADGSPKINDHSGQSTVVSAESSVNEMLLQLQLMAQDPKKGHNSLNTIITFFAGFKSSVAVNKRGRKKKSDKAINGSAEEFEFDDVNDSYWTDRIVQNYSEKQLMHHSESGAGNQLVPFDAERSVKPGRKSRKRFFSGNYPTASSELDEKVKRRKQETSPAELILNFAERSRVPSEINLNKMFRRFGPLMESETEVDHDSARARVIFKRGSDAEVAHSSAQKFSIFGPVLVNYEIGYSPLISVKILPLAIPQDEENATVMM